MPIATSEYISPTSAPLIAEFEQKSPVHTSGLLYRERAFDNADFARFVADLAFISTVFRSP